MFAKDLAVDPPDASHTQVALAPPFLSNEGLFDFLLS